MAFSFNWAGLTVPTFDKIQNPVDMNQVGKDLGRATRGYYDRKSADKYADMIDNYVAGERASQSQDARDVEDIKAEIARLEAENVQLQHAADVAKEPVQAQDTGDDEEDILMNWAINFDPKTATKEEIMQMQEFIGATPDGVWGPKSQEAYQRYMSNSGQVVGTGFDPNGASVDDIKAMQTYIGATPDGVWGPNSQAAYQKYLANLGITQMGGPGMSSYPR